MKKNLAILGLAILLVVTWLRDFYHGLTTLEAKRHVETLKLLVDDCSQSRDPLSMKENLKYIASAYPQPCKDFRDEDWDLLLNCYQSNVVSEITRHLSNVTNVLTKTVGNQ